MKYKYYLRGLGIGILVATLILTLSGKGSSKASSSSAAAETPSEEKTLAEVAAEPKEQKEPKEAEEEAPLQQTVLEVDGSAFAEDEKEYWEENAAASDVSDEERPENDEAEAESLENIEAETETESLAIIEAEPEDTAADVGETSNIVEEIIVKAPQEEEPQPENEETNVSPGESVQVIIPKGAGSRKTAEVLKKAGLVPNAVEFDDYLCKHRYDTKIHSGAKTIPGGASYEEIAKIITTGN